MIINFVKVSAMTGQPTPPPRGSALLAEAACLGPVRIVVRNPSGFVEVFCDSDSFRLSAGWLHICKPTTHLHVRLESLTEVLLLEPSPDAHPTRPSIWLVGRCGAPCLLIILDQTEGDARRQQERAFAALRERWGHRVPLEDRGSRLLH